MPLSEHIHSSVFTGKQEFALCHYFVLQLGKIWGGGSLSVWGRSFPPTPSSRLNPANSLGVHPYLLDPYPNALGVHPYLLDPYPNALGVRPYPLDPYPNALGVRPYLLDPDVPASLDLQ